MFRWWNSLDWTWFVLLASGCSRWASGQERVQWRVDSSRWVKQTLLESILAEKPQGFCNDPVCLESTATAESLWVWTKHLKASLRSSYRWWFDFCAPIGQILCWCGRSLWARRPRRAQVLLPPTGSGGRSFWRNWSSPVCCWSRWVKQTHLKRTGEVKQRRQTDEFCFQFLRSAVCTSVTLLHYKITAIKK